MSETTGIGIDLGTSGARAVAVAESGHVLARETLDFDSPAARRDPKVLLETVRILLSGLAAKVPMERAVIATAGTSGSLVPLGSSGQASGAISMYYEQASASALQAVSGHAPLEAPVHGTSSALARGLDVLAQGATALAFEPDYIGSCLAGRPVAADVNSALKFGCDPVGLRWPDWLTAVGIGRAALPALAVPGAGLSQMDTEVARGLGLPVHTMIAAGTTDGCAAALAAGIERTGDAVTSLGSTLVLKMLVDSPITDPRRGIYSHRVAGRWLVGGASNAGGAVLRHFYDDAQMQEMSAQIDPVVPTGLNYVPLLSSGERFPVADPYLMPCFAPRPEDESQFFQGLLEALATHEAKGYRAVEELSRTAPARIFTTGGGTKNPGWMAVRRVRLTAPVVAARSIEAAEGAAWLALRSERLARGMADTLADS